MAIGANQNFGWGRYDIGEYELLKLLETLSPEAQVRAGEALGDFEGGRYCAFDAALLRAFCFQRQGTTLLYHYWNDVPTPELAGRLFAKLPPDHLPLTTDVVEQVYRAEVLRKP